jgi:hypothetical protein
MRFPIVLEFNASRMKETIIAVIGGHTSNESLHENVKI